MDPQQYKKINNILGWSLFMTASAVFLATLEPTASFWDCGERISCSFKLQVAHPPGAPLYQMMARMFSLLAFGDLSRVAFWINAMSAFMGGLTVMFLFWTISMLGRRLLQGTQELNIAQTWAIWGAGIVGALTLTFSDSFWFTAVEAEVYVTSLFMTAFVFWSILKWDANEHKEDSLKWLVLISFVVGLSIGVHMLNLLAIPAIVFVYYFKKFKASPKGIILTGIVAVLLLGFIQGVFIPGVFTVEWWFERFFVNSLGMPFHSGTVFYLVLLAALIIGGLYYTQQKKKVVFNTIILCFMFILIGYSSFLMLVIRSNAHVPVNENAPKDALALQAYLGREQYGSWPLVHGPYYNAPLKAIEDGNPVYRKDSESGKYIIINERRSTVPIYNPEFTTVFPRMHSRRPHHIRAYENWGNVTGRPVRVQLRDGSSEVINKPSFGENLRFFFSYQIGHMYMRYLMWNFSGRQNDIQGHGSPVEGNWITGIPFVDQVLVGPQKHLPESMTANKGYSRFFMLPFLLGLLGFFHQLKKRPHDALVVGLLFFMTGMAIVIYLNQTPYQPRERDYSYIGSFYAFAIWVGLGVLGLVDFLSKKLNGKMAAILATCASLLLVPAVMAKENWNNHDRSGRYTTRDVAINYLESCAPNAIIFTNGDNDTFPLWYAQEVEGVRPDIKIVNMSLLNTDWYIDHMTRRKTYDADPVPYSMQPHQYRDGTRDFVYIIEDPRITDHVDLRRIMDFITDERPAAKRSIGRTMENYFPTRKFRIPVDSATVVNNGTVAPEDAHLIVPAIEWTFNPGPEEMGVNKNLLMALDFLSVNNWERPVYFAITTGSDVYMGLEEYFQLEGMAYRLVPIRAQSEDGQTGRINTNILYDNIMNKFQWGNMNGQGVYLNEDHLRLAVNFRNIFQRLAHALIREGKTEKAIEVLDRAMEVMPERNVPFNYFTLLLAEAYYAAGAPEKANPIVERMLEKEEQNLRYYFSFTGRKANLIEPSKQESLALLQRLNHAASIYEQADINQRASAIFENYYRLYMQGY